MRIYANFENVGSEYDSPVPVEISLSTPIKGSNVWYVDLEKGESCSVFGENWKPYEGKMYMGNHLYNPKTKEYIDSRIVSGCFGPDGDYVELEDGRRFDEDGYDGEYSTYAGGYESEWFMYQNYKDGKPSGKPYFVLE